MKLYSETEIERFVSTIAFFVPVLDMEKLLDLALESYNNYKSEDRKINLLDFYNNIEFANRVCVNYLRHNSGYNIMLKAKYVQSTYYNLLVKNKILAEIATAYPNLKEECIRQFGEKLRLQKI